MLTIVLLPGMDGTGSLFAPFVSALGNDFNLITVRYPTTEACGYQELEEIARQSLPEGQNFILLGESFSGPIAVSLAASRPEGLVGLVLCSTFIRNPRPSLKPLRSLSAFLPVKLTPAFIYNYFLLGRAATPALASCLKTAVDQVSSTAFRARLRAILSIDVSAQMKLISVPILYLQASLDRVVPPAAGSDVVNINPATKVLSVDAPHFLLQTAPETAASMVKNFAYAICGRKSEAQ